MCALHLTHYDDAQLFLEKVQPFLAAKEAEHNLILGLAGRLVSSPLMYGFPPYLVAVSDANGSVLGAALRTPPHNLILSEFSSLEVVSLVVNNARTVYDQIPGILGPSETSRYAAQAWSEISTQQAELLRGERIFRCATVIPPRPTSGSMRRARLDDRDLLVQWADEFTAEALPDAPVSDSEEMINSRFELEDPLTGLYIWEDGEPVSFAGCGSPTPTGVRIGPVYTPPAFRGRGYASALTAQMTEQLLASGRAFVFLFTDLANPTSNKIYQAVGYEAVSDVDEWRFVPPPVASGERG